MQVRVNNCDLFYSSSGSGTPMVLVHGFPLDHTIWAPQIEDLSKDHWVIAPDLRGHGQSEAAEATYTMDLLARDVNGILDHLMVGPVVLGGLSMGGYVAFAFLRRFRQRIRALILVDTKAEADTQEGRAQREQLAQTVLRDGPGVLVDQMMAKMFSQKTLSNNKDLVGRVRAVMEGTKPTGIAGALRGMAERPDSMPLLDSIRVPTLIIVGEEDSLTTLGDARRMADKIPGSELVVIPEAAHLATLEKPEEVNAAIRRFLQRLSAAQEIPLG